VVDDRTVSVYTAVARITAVPVDARKAQVAVIVALAAFFHNRLN
jgi:hypothetical protein